MAAITILSDFGAQESVTVSTFSPSICHEVMGPDAMFFIFGMLSFKPAFHSPLSLSSGGSLDPLCFLPLEWYHLHILHSWVLETNCLSVGYCSGCLLYTLIDRQPRNAEHNK